MAKQVKQWLAVYDEIFRTDENARRYYALTCWNVRHQNAQLKMQTVKRNGKLYTIVTIKVDGGDYFNAFCKLASNVKGLYDIDDILASVEVVNEYNKR